VNHIQLNSLVLYKNQPAQVIQLGERIIIAMQGGAKASVRPKDVALLHPGPLFSLNDLTSPEGEVETAWQILLEAYSADHSKYDLAELAELIYGEFTPASAWTTWQCFADGLYFQGTPEAIIPRSSIEVAQECTARQEKAIAAQTWAESLARLKAGSYLQEDITYLHEVEELASVQRAESRLLRELGIPEKPEHAHSLLLKLGYRDIFFNPHPLRLGLNLSMPQASLPPLSDETRLDLTHLATFAIDDQGNRDPDDALSLEWIETDSSRFVGGRLWVHVADVATLVARDSSIDLDARLRGTTIYLPEGTVPMLPTQLIELLGLGLLEVSPALSFGITLDASGIIRETTIQPSWVRVQRLTYEQVEDQLDDKPFQDLYQIALAYQSRRKESGALLIDMPEAMIRLADSKVIIRPLANLRSRDLVREAMIMAGEAAARFATQNRIPFLFAAQEGFEPDDAGIEGSLLSPSTDDLARQYAFRRQLKRSHVSIQPSPHAGVGLSAYSRVTSPLRRYFDLMAHQQLRSFIQSAPPLSEAELLERIGSSEAATGSANQAEWLSRRHWTLVYLMQNPDCLGEGILVEKHGLRAKVILPELAFETNVYIKEDVPLNTRLWLKFKAANLPLLEANFQVLA